MRLAVSVLILFMLLAGCHRAVVRKSGSSQTAVSPIGQADLVYIAVVRNVVKSSDLQDSKLFISVAERDPSASLLKRLRQNGYKAVSLSQAKKHTKTDMPLELSEVRWIGKFAAEVDIQQIFHKTAGHSTRYHLKLLNNQWRVTAKSPRWAS